MTNRQKAIKLEIVPQPKHKYQVNRNWLDLPSEVTANILNRIDVVDILESAEKVCTAWREICKDPAMRRVLHMDPSSDPNINIQMCKQCVDRSQGQLVDITIAGFGNDEILEYIANRSSQLKRLTFVCRDGYMQTWRESLKKFPLLEELNVYAINVTNVDIQTAGRYCPLLKTLKLNQNDSRFWDNLFYWLTEEDKTAIYDKLAMHIGRHLRELRHLELTGSVISNKGLKMILDGCHRLESLDLRGCFLIDLDGDLGKRCLQQVKCVKLPNDSIEGCPLLYQNDGTASDVDDESEERYYDESDGGSYEESDIESDFVYESEGGYGEESDEE